MARWSRAAIPASRRATWCCTWADGATKPLRPASALNKLPAIPGVEPQAFLGNLGLTGGTAYFGLLEAASAKEGDIVFVSAAAGAVGSAVVQIAKAKGMTVIGSAGGADKCDFVRSLGADEVVDYKAGPVLKQLAGAAPKGIDVYFDNVGGDHLDAALAVARKDARFAICGMIEGYNDAHPTQLRYIMRVIAMRIRLQGFIYTDYLSENGRLLPRHGRLDRQRPGQGARHGGRGAGTDAGSIPRPVQRRQHRQDARSPSSARSCRPTACPTAAPSAARPSAAPRCRG